MTTSIKNKALKSEGRTTSIKTCIESEFNEQINTLRSLNKIVHNYIFKITQLQDII